MPHAVLAKRAYNGCMQDQNQKSSARTLLVSVIMSTPGPLVVGLGLLVGRSSTQLADFFRRSAELLAIICAYVIHRMTTSDEGCDEERRARLERGANRFIGAMMCVAGAAIGLLALLGGQAEKGNVVPGLVIALMGVVANAIFWLRYRSLNTRQPNAIVATQARLYRAKTFVDFCVSSALITVLAAPGTALASFVDLAGSIIVAVYMVYSGIKTARETGETGGRGSVSFTE